MCYHNVWFLYRMFNHPCISKVKSTFFFSLIVVFVHSVVANTLRPQQLQHARLPFPSLSPGACSNSCPFSQWCHQTISSSVPHFYSCLQSFPASGSFPMSRLFASGGQSIGTYNFGIRISNEYSGLVYNDFNMWVDSICCLYIYIHKGYFLQFSFLLVSLCQGDAGFI